MTSGIAIGLAASVVFSICIACLALGFTRKERKSFMFAVDDLHAELKIIRKEEER